ncbi:TolB family protein [Lentzea tibetensis]|uniref:TolB family protein n=1 Tax=Lentzea tibetensis TaxID=2591470 RepID=UPI001648D0B6|nr:PD40 domain-containing protein [Lentzea tibetensis]
MAPIVVLSTAGPAHAEPDAAVTSRVSVATDGGQGDKKSQNPALSADGRYVAFDSEATLVPGDTNDDYDVFVRDRLTGTTTRVSVASDGSQGTAVGEEFPHPYSSSPSISADGRYVAFTSNATNLVPGDTNTAADVFVHDRQTGTTSRVSVATGGGQVRGGGFYASISADGRYVTFVSDAADLVPGDTNQRRDVFRHDRETGLTTRISVSTAGGQSNGSSDYSEPVMSADGRFVAFRSWATNLVPGDTNQVSDVFLRDTQQGTTTRISVASDGTEANELSYEPSISADGRYVAYGSGASNLVPGDGNHAADIFRYDRLTGTTIRISPAAATFEHDLPDGAKLSAISRDGRHVAYSSDALDIVPDDTNRSVDVFVHDVATGVTKRVSRTATGAQAANWSRYFSWSSRVAMSADGQYFAYDSGATDLVDTDTNGVWDVFVSSRP